MAKKHLLLRVTLHFLPRTLAQAYQTNIFKNTSSLQTYVLHTGLTKYSLSLGLVKRKRKIKGTMNIKTGNKVGALMGRLIMCVAMAIASLTMPCYCLAQDNGHGKSKLLTFEKTVHDFGNITHEDGAQHCSFKYKNHTDTTILIYDVKVFCNCTKVEWPRKPIKPGDEGEIKVVYDNEGSPHHFDKGVSVYTSTGKRPVLLRIKGTVIE